MSLAKNASLHPINELIKGKTGYRIKDVSRPKFILNSDQLELLLAFEGAKGLAHLAELMTRDPSVISRNLQRIAEECPVIAKVKGRWEMTPLGIQVNQQTRTYLEQQSSLISPAVDKRPVTPSLCGDNSTLIIINAQNGLFGPTQEARNNSEAENNIARLLAVWRAKRRKVIHVKHVSENPNSIFFKNSAGCDFLKMIHPIGDEPIVEKTKSSAFMNTSLEGLLNSFSCPDIILVGFTANECIDATARDAAALGFVAYVISDATATFDLREADGRLVKADRIHKLTLLNINAFSAKVVTTGQILA